MTEPNEGVEIEVKAGKCANMKAYMKTYMKDYHNKHRGEKQCECGATIKQLNFNHKQTSKHKNYLKMKELEDKIKQLQA